MKKLIAMTVMFLIFSAYAQDSALVVFDGDGKKSGSGWADPKDSVTLGITDTVKFNNKSTLELKAKCKGWWAGGGWNWTNWSGPGDDITQYDYLSFQIRKTSGSLKDLWVQLADSTNKVSCQMNIVENGCTPPIGDEFAKVAVPLSKLTGDFNKKSVSCMNFAEIGRAHV